jgi:hypothetical protein
MGLLPSAAATWVVVSTAHGAPSVRRSYVGGSEYCAWGFLSVRLCSFLRIQPLTWYPKDSGGSLRLGARARVLTGYSQGTLSAPSVGAAHWCAAWFSLDSVARWLFSFSLASRYI